MMANGEAATTTPTSFGSFEDAYCHALYEYAGSLLHASADELTDYAEAKFMREFRSPYREGSAPSLDELATGIQAAGLGDVPYSVVLCEVCKRYYVDFDWPACPECEAGPNGQGQEG